MLPYGLNLLLTGRTFAPAISLGLGELRQNWKAVRQQVVTISLDAGSGACPAARGLWRRGSARSTIISRRRARRSMSDTSEVGAVSEALRPGRRDAVARNFSQLSGLDIGPPPSFLDPMSLSRIGLARP